LVTTGRDESRDDTDAEAGDKCAKDGGGHLDDDADEEDEDTSDDTELASDTVTDGGTEKRANESTGRENGDGESKGLAAGGDTTLSGLTEGVAKGAKPDVHRLDTVQ
jgi:hypothetical protein